MIVVSEERPSPVARQGQIVVVKAPEELDLNNADGLRDALLEALSAGARGLVVDMTATTFCDSAGITALTRAARRAAAGAATMRLAVTAEPVLRLLNLVGIDRLIDVDQSVAASLKSLSDPGDGPRLETG